MAQRSEPGRALIAVSTRSAATVIALDSPHNRNALSSKLIRQLVAALRDAEADAAVRAIVLTHTGGTFCAGADLSESVDAAAGDPARHRAEQLTDLLETIVRCRKPVIGLIDGHVRAGGIGLVGACDVVIAGPSSTFGLTESRLGLAAAVISLTVLPRLTSRAAARLFLTGETIGPAEAAQIGLVTDAVEDVDARLDGLLGELARCSPQGLAESKVLVTHDILRGFERDRERVIEQSARLFSSDEAREGMRAFLDKRPPSWAVPPA